MSTDSYSIAMQKKRRLPQAAPKTPKGVQVTAPNSLYRTPNSGYGFRKCCEVVRNAVPIEEHARRYTKLERFGGNAWFTGRCPLPEHEDQTPSFYIYPPGRYYCYGCGGSGDVVDLEFHCGDYGELWEAMISLAIEYDVELPKRPQRWHDKEARHARWREEAEKVRANVLRRRLFRLLILPIIDGIEDEEERAVELERAWQEFADIPSRLFTYRENAA
jgi:CHC2 zinc finger